MWVLADIPVGKELFKGYKIGEEFDKTIVVIDKWVVGKFSKMQDEFSWTTTCQWFEVELLREDLWKGNTFSWKVTFLETIICKVSRIRIL